jgi:DMSO/TMAO reductase YedYZ molybdopterin-dependent catalytic subunit
VRRIHSVLFLLASTLTVWLNGAMRSAAQTGAPDLVVRGAVAKELQLTLANLKQMPRTSVTAKDHGGTSHTYEGVALQSLLAEAGLPHGGDIRAKNMVLAVVAKAGDGYRAVFSLAELDADFSGTQVLVVDTADSKPLAEKEGPLRLVVPGDKRPARWVRMLKSIKVVSVE